MSTLTTAQRDALPASAFCGPGRTFPILDASDVKSAAHLIGKAANPAAVKRCVMAKARAHKWPIPDAWQAHMSADGTDTDTDNTNLTLEERDGQEQAEGAETADERDQERELRACFTEEGWEEVAQFLATAEGELGGETFSWASNKGNLAALMRYWKNQMGSGSGRPGDFNECVATLSRHADKISDPKALCAWMHKQVTGARPGHAAAEHSRGFTPALDVEDVFKGPAYVL